MTNNASGHKSNVVPKKISIHAIPVLQAYINSVVFTVILF